MPITSIASKKDSGREKKSSIVDDRRMGSRVERAGSSFVRPQPKNVDEGSSRRRALVLPGVVIVGAGPSGMATAACLSQQGIPYLILERDKCLGSSWKLRMYDRLRLHLPKEFCELPLMGFPREFPTYPTKQEFVWYLDEYARRFEIEAEYGVEVRRAEYEEGVGMWRVVGLGGGGVVVDLYCRWLVVASGESAEKVVPEVEGMGGFQGRLVHTSCYRSAEDFAGQRVLVVGCGNSGMEVCLDLCNHGACTCSLAVRDEVHILPREMLGMSTFGLSMWLLKWLPIRIVDAFLLFFSRIILGDTTRLGLKRPKIGPLELKNRTGKTPVLDVGTLSKIKCGHIKVVPGIRRFVGGSSVEFMDGKKQRFDSVIMATGYRSNVPTWLKDEEFFSKKDGYPRNPFPESWKGRNGLYATGFTKRGLLGAAMDARRIAYHIASQWQSETNHHPL